MLEVVGQCCALAGIGERYAAAKGVANPGLYGPGLVGGHDEEAEESEVAERPLRDPRPQTSQSKSLDYWEKR